MNGAPPPPQRHSSTAAVVAGVVVGAFVVLAIIGILAAIAIPNLLTAMQRSRQKRALADIRAIGTAIETYHDEKGAFPTDLRTLGELPIHDPWTTLYSIEFTRDGRNYYVGSAGADKSFDLSFGQYAEATTTHFDCDIIYANGAFVQRPEGAP